MNIHDVQDEANYTAMIPPRSEFAGMSLNECILRASKIEDMMTDCGAFNETTTSEGDHLILMSHIVA